MAIVTAGKGLVLGWVDRHAAQLSAWHQVIWHYAEPALREYKSAAWYVRTLQDAGFDVEVGSGGMPTAFVATFRHGDGPTIATYAEYDAVPGQCQAATPHAGPRAGLSRHAAGHTDPHSALGISALAGALATKAAMQELGIRGTLKIFGEPAEKLRVSKPVHAAKGYYDDLDAAVSFHPHWSLPMCNTAVWDTHCGFGYNYVYTFSCAAPEKWLTLDRSGKTRRNVHYAARAPGATDALMFFHHLNESSRRSMLPATGLWSFNEAILTAGQATADNLVSQLAEIDYMVRANSQGEADAISAVMDINAAAAAKAGFCEWKKTWVSKSRAGLANHTLARAGYRNLELVGPPSWGPEAIQVAHAIQRELGLAPLERPFLAATETLIDPQAAEAAVRRFLPVTQNHLGSDDYTEYTWHCPTLRLLVARPELAASPDYDYPGWVPNALGGIPATIDPTILIAAKTIGATLIDLLTDAALLEEAGAEFVERSGIGSERWQAPLLPSDFQVPHRLRWPEYVTTARGEEWCIPWREDE